MRDFLRKVSLTCFFPFPGCPGVHGEDFEDLGFTPEAEKAGPRILNKFVESRFCSSKCGLLSNLSENRLRQSASSHRRESRIEVIILAFIGRNSNLKMAFGRISSGILHRCINRYTTLYQFVYDENTQWTGRSTEYANRRSGTQKPLHAYGKRLDQFACTSATDGSNLALLPGYTS